MQTYFPSDALSAHGAALRNARGIQPTTAATIRRASLSECREALWTLHEAFVYRGALASALTDRIRQLEDRRLAAARMYYDAVGMGVDDRPELEPVAAIMSAYALSAGYSPETSPY